MGDVGREKSVSKNRQVYYVGPRPSGRIFPLTTKQEWISEHSPIFRDNNSIVLVLTQENHDAIQEKFSADLAEHDLRQRILTEVETILNSLHEHHATAGMEHRDVKDEQRNAHEFLRRGILRYVAECTRRETGGPPIVDLLQLVGLLTSRR